MGSKKMKKTSKVGAFDVPDGSVEEKKVRNK